MTNQNHAADMRHWRNADPKFDRTAIIGNSGGGKSTLARLLATRHDLPYIEIDRLLWRPGWELTPEEDFNTEHDHIVARDRWLIDGLGRQESASLRLERATAIVLVDMPLWMHFWLAAERQIAWAKGDLVHAPGEISQMPPTEALFRTIWRNDQDWMPMLRDLSHQREQAGAWVERIQSVDQLSKVQQALTGP